MPAVVKSDSQIFAELLQSSSNGQDFLDNAVVHIAKVLKSDACSIFLYDASSKILTLRATNGLGRKSVGKVSLSIDEGLVGLTLREQRPVLEKRGSDHPLFKLFPETEEERYQAFLSVPIFKGTTPVGVIVLQDEDLAVYQESDVKTLREMASGLAATLENVQMLLDLHSPKKEPQVTSEGVLAELIRGRGASEGVAIGQAFLLTTSENLFLELPQGESYHASLNSFRVAVKRSIDQLEELQKETEARLTDVASLIFSTHILMLKDSSFSGQMETEISEGTVASVAVVKVVNQYVEIFHKSPSARLREKIQDVKDLGHRLLRNLSMHELPDGDYFGQVVVAQELLPSELVKISAQHAEGILLYGGGASAHVSILAKSLGIPVIFSDDRAIFSIKEAENLILDGFQGNVYINPKEEVRAQFQQLKFNYLEAQKQASDVAEKTVTQDGVTIHLFANVNLLSDLQISKSLKAEGIGLYRSEFPFIIRNDFPTEEEQFVVYRKIVNEMKGNEVVLRTLDIGGDKVLSYMPLNSESNPFLGLRAIRFSLKNIAIFHEQLRAMLRAGHGHELRIMFPLVSSLDDFREARGHVLDCIKQLKLEKVSHNDHPLIGAMIELPSACEVANELAKESDFLCVGTNDLVQYILGVDRTNEAVSYLYTAHHPAVFRTLQRVVRAAINHDCPISICGEIAADPKMIPFFLGAGIRKLSVNPKLIPQVQKIVQSLSYRECQVFAEKLVQFGSIKEIQAHLGVDSQ